MPKLAVVGQPIAHSLSPAMQTAALEACGLAGEWTYEALELSPTGFATEIGRLAGAGWRGLNVTIPHKAAALAVATEASAAAREIGAANTLSFEAAPEDRGGSPRIAADNTDAPALIDALGAEGCSVAGKRALVLGAGGSARAMVWALREGGAAVTIWNRTHARGADLAAAMGVAVVAAAEPPHPEDFSIVVNTTAVGLGSDTSSSRGAAFKALGFGADQLNDQQVVVDLAYGSAETELIETAKGRGARTIDGLEILVRQGARSFEIWTGLEPPLATMRSAVRPRHE